MIKDISASQKRLCHLLRKHYKSAGAICWENIILHSHPEIEISYKFIPKILMSKECIHIWATLYMEHPFLMFLDHTQRRTTVGRTPLDERSARRRDLYLTTHDTQVSGLRPITCWDRGFESHRGHGYLSVVNVVCCQVEVSATSWSLVQRSPTDCGASLCVI